MPRVATVRPNGKAIRAQRVRQGLSTNQLGKMTGRHPQSIRNLELRDWPASELFVNQVANALKVVGRAEYVKAGIPGQNAINNPGAAGAISITARKGVFLYATDGSVGAAQVGLVCFALDDNNVTATDRASGASVQQYAAAGVVVAIDPSGQVWVDFWHQATVAA